MPILLLLILLLFVPACSNTNPPVAELAEAASMPRSLSVDPDELEWLSPPATEADPADATVRASDAEWLRRALDEVPDEQRRAVVLAGILGFTAQDVAEREGIPIGTAKSRIRLAMEKLSRARADTEASR